MTSLEKIIHETTGYKLSRVQTATFVMEHPELLDLFFDLCFETKNPDHYKACWAMELIAYEKLDCFEKYLPLICEKAKTLSHESAIRPVSKVILVLIEASDKNKTIVLSEQNCQDLIEINFDWLINDSKVATKAYAMRSLYILGKKTDWIHQELKTILLKDFGNHTAAYKAVSKQILKKIK